jgi:TPR repeat protein
MRQQVFRFGKWCIGFLWLFFFIIYGSNGFASDYGIGRYWPSWDAYDKMDCSKLRFEYTMMRKDLEALQRTENFNSKKWNEAKTRYGLVIQFYEKRCRSLTPAERAIPSPPSQKLLPEEQLVKTAMQAIRAGRYKAGEKLLLQGASAGYPDAQYNLGMFYMATGQRQEGKKWLRSATYLGHVKAKEALDSIK